MRKIGLVFSIIFVFALSLFLSSCDNLKEFKYDNDYMTVAVGETQQSTSVKSFDKVNFYSGDESIAQVDNKGNVTGIQKGETIIYALFKNKPYKLFVNVINSVDNLEIYEQDLLLIGDMDKTDIKPALPLKAKYYGSNNKAEFTENMKIQITCDFLSVSDNLDERNYESKAEQIRDNLKYALVTMLYLKTQFRDLDLIPYYETILSYEQELDRKEGEELDNIIKNFDPLTGYFYISNDYIACALFKNDELKAYLYSDDDYGIISKIKSRVLLASQLLNDGLDLQKLDYIDLLKDFDGALISDEKIAELKRYQDFASVLTYILLGEVRLTKTSIDDDINKQRIALDITENGVTKLNEITELEITSAHAELDLYRDENTHYNFVKRINVRFGINFLGVGGLTDLNLKFGDSKVINDEADNVFIYEKNHSEYEKVVFDSGDGE